MVLCSGIIKDRCITEDWKSTVVVPIYKVWVTNGVWFIQKDMSRPRFGNLPDLGYTFHGHIKVGKVKYLRSSLTLKQSQFTWAVSLPVG